MSNRRQNPARQTLKWTAEGVVKGVIFIIMFPEYSTTYRLRYRAGVMIVAL